MDKKVFPFPPTVDLDSANWSLYGVDANNVITARNNQIIADLAVQRIDFGDHIYDFPQVLRLDRESIK